MPRPSGSAAEPSPDEEASYEATAIVKEEEKVEAALSHREEEEALAARLRRAGLDPRKPLTGKEAEDWADTKMVELLPLAIANLSEDLRYGSSGQRAAATRQVLEATGRARKEAMMGGGSPIVILTGAGDLEGPWRKAAKLMADAAKEVSKTAQVVEGEVVDAKK